MSEKILPSVFEAAVWRDINSVLETLSYNSRGAGSFMWHSPWKGRSTDICQEQTGHHKRRWCRCWSYPVRFGSKHMRKARRRNNLLLTHLGSAMRDRRLDIHLTQQELAAATKMHRTYIVDIESGRRNLSMLTYRKLTDALRCAMSLPMIDAERSMAREAAAQLYGVKGGLSQTSLLLHSSSTFFRNLHIDSLKLDVMSNMSKLQFAVETFASEHKRYPKNLSELEQALADRILVNPFTQLPESPIIGTAIDEELATRVSCELQPGEIEYSPMNNGANYIIRGGDSNGRALPGASPGSTYVLSGNLRTYNQP